LSACGARDREAEAAAPPAAISKVARRRKPASLAYRGPKPENCRRSCGAASATYASISATA
jgi:hypothetical protein